jgi:hypothetical protein
MPEMQQAKRIAGLVVGWVVGLLVVLWMVNLASNALFALYLLATSNDPRVGTAAAKPLSLALFIFGGITWDALKRRRTKNSHDRLGYTGQGKIDPE